MPKQFVKLFVNDHQNAKDKKSLFQLTVERNSKVCKKQFIVSNTEQYFLAQDQLEELTTHHSLLTNKGWKHSIELKQGIEKMYKWYLGNKK